MGSALGHGFNVMLCTTMHSCWQFHARCQTWRHQYIQYDPVHTAKTIILPALQCIPSMQSNVLQFYSPLKLDGLSSWNLHQGQILDYAIRLRLWTIVAILPIYIIILKETATVPTYGFENEKMLLLFITWFQWFGLPLQILWKFYHIVNTANAFIEFILLQRSLICWAISCWPQCYAI